MFLGLVVATRREMDIFMVLFKSFEDRTRRIGGFTVRSYVIGPNTLYAVQSGAGEIRAAAATQILISTLKVQRIYNIGVCGGLAEDLPSAEALLVSNVIRYEYDTSAVDGCEVGKYEQYPSIYIPSSIDLVHEVSDSNPGIRRVTCASGNRFLGSAVDKMLVRKRFETAQVCDMEAAGVLITADMANIPAVLIKAVSDGADEGADQYDKIMDRAMFNCVIALLNALVAAEKGGQV